MGVEFKKIRVFVEDLGSGDKRRHERTTFCAEVDDILVHGVYETEGPMDYEAPRDSIEITARACDGSCKNNSRYQSITGLTVPDDIAEAMQLTADEINTDPEE